MYPTLSLYIDGQFISGGGRREQDVLNPATNQVIAKLPHATREDLDLALTSAQRAFESWRKTSPMERGKVLRKIAELARERSKDIGRGITLDQGKPLAEAVGEVVACSEHEQQDFRNDSRTWNLCLGINRRSNTCAAGAREHYLRLKVRWDQVDLH